MPFVCKATGVSLAKLAAKVMLGHKLVDLGYTETIIPPHFSVKEAVFPWNRYPGIDIVLGPDAPGATPFSPSRRRCWK